MRPTRRTNTSPHTSGILQRRSTHQSSIPVSKKKTNKIYAIGKCQTYLLLISLLFNFLLIYWAAESFTRSIPNVPICATISNEPNHPCNPDYLSKLIESNPKLQSNLQLNRIIPESARTNQPQKTRNGAYIKRDKPSIQIQRDKPLVKMESDKASVPPLESVKASIKRMRDAAFASSNTFGNKILFSDDLQIKTAAKAPAYDEMSTLGDSHKRELSWISPLSRGSVSGDPNRRPNPHLYITESEHELWFNNRLFVFEKEKVAFCVMEKNSCSMFKQIFKRIRGKKDYLSTDYTKIHYLPYRGLEDISFYDINSLSRFLNNDEFYFATFVREPLERLVSGYIDKCDKKRGVNLCDYARWSPLFQAEYGDWGSGKRASFTPSFDMWVDGLFHCPCWPETDWHFAPQFNFCNLYQYVDKYDVFRFENRTHRKIWMERAGLWDTYGKSGWKTSNSNDDVSIVEFGPQSHSSTAAHKGVSKYIDVYKNVNADILASIIDHYRNDYIIFGIQMADWMCDGAIPINDNVKRALRTLPRTSRPPCDNYRWLWERE